jgi:CheY-like chemotaxis protein
VKIYSELGRGTTVRLYLPRLVEGRQRAAPAATESEEHPRGSETILVVEDDSLVRDYVVNALTALGYGVIAASDGPAALGELEKGARVDLLLTDIVMPGGMSGVDLADEARRRRPSLKVLFTSGYPQGALARRAQPVVPSPSLGKPYRKAELARIIRAALEAPPAQVGRAGA